MVSTTTRTPMPVKMRAKQFMMFDAMKGLTEAIAEKEHQYYPRRELTEERKVEINGKLSAINKGDWVTVVYYCQYGMRYRQLSGKVVRVDNYWKVIQIDAVSISFDELFDIAEDSSAKKVY